MRFFAKQTRDCSGTSYRHERGSERNLGIEYWQIPIALRRLLDDAKTWVACETYPLDEIGVRYHHRLSAADAGGRRAFLVG
jgi:hypothetical protein